ncbi:hypothetical protein ACIBI3_05030 [Actinomadura luteofluorescens]|uniref:hypothetical protein n=1 Tax=Actinomadura luteofluorescens TaxID=46163 RepID=UPI003479D6B5
MPLYGSGRREERHCEPDERLAWALHLVSGVTTSKLALEVELAGRIVGHRMIMTR